MANINGLESLNMNSFIFYELLKKLIVTNIKIRV